MLSVVPDIHADLERLDLSLRGLGDHAPFAFLGDFIDAGKHTQQPDDRAVLRKIRAMIDGGDAVAIMGNHELNAALYHRIDKQGRPLRAHDEKNSKQHRSFISQFGTATTEAKDWTEWFLTALPLWRDFGDVRLIHACWDDTAISIVKERRPDGLLHADDLDEIAAERTPFGRAVKKIVSGPEIRLPDPYAFTDRGNDVRKEVRIAWWRNDADTWRRAALSVPNKQEIPDVSLPAELRPANYFSHLPPVFFGHYKMTGMPILEAPNAICLDYLDAPCGYTWQGESTLKSENIKVFSSR